MREDFYRNIIEQSPMGYAYHRMIYDGEGKPCDYEYLDVNPAFETFTGLRCKDVLGKRVKDFYPNIGESPTDWLGLYGDVAQNGKVMEMDVFSDLLQRWYRVKAFSDKPHHFVTYFVDISQEVNQRSILEHSQQVISESEQKYRQLFENAVEAIVVLQNGHIMLSNPMAGMLTGYTETELLEIPFLELLFPEDREHAMDTHIARYSTTGHDAKQVIRLRHKDGSYKWIETNGIPIQWNNENALLCFIMDITNRKYTEDALKASEAMYRLLTEFTSDVIWTLNLTQGRFTYISPSIYGLRGITVEEAMAESLSDTMTPESLEVVSAAIQRNLQEFHLSPDSPNTYINEIQQPCKDGSIIWVEVSTKYRFTAEGEVEVVGVSRNIEERKQNEERVLYLSYHDQLTGLYNRRFYEEELRRLATPRNLPVTLVMADVNGLKLTNDAFGHLVGDELLISFADILKDKARADDIISRMGGDEFVLLLPQTTAEQAEKIVQRIKTAISEVQAGKTILSVSFGWATRTQMSESMEDIFRQAEDRMYRKKLLESTSMKSETIKLITKSLYEKNAIEQQHCERVSALCKQIGIELGLGADMVDELGLLGLLHDIGKIGISEDILNKSEALNPLEWQEIKRHPEIGYQILRSVNEFAAIADYVLSHHERMDGGGYPRGLKADQIPLQSKILSIAEAYDTMTHVFPYRKALSVRDALDKMEQQSSGQFDPIVLSVFRNLIEDSLKVH